jgi:uncharacterized protein
MADLSLRSFTRRQMLGGSIAAGAAALTTKLVPAAAVMAAEDQNLHQRPAKSERRFTSDAVEETILRVQKQITDPTLSLIFANCLPNTLDTTVFPSTLDGKPDTFVITGDIDAMWLRDSSAQVWPYLAFCKQDKQLATLVEGVIHRQARCIAIDPYANAYLKTPHDSLGKWSSHDDTEMKPGVSERKWEVDSLCYTLRLAHGYWQATGSTAPFDDAWKASARLVIKTFREQQRLHGQGPYHFQRESKIPSETLMLNGYGNPIKPNGMIFSGFRPSDDACIFPLFVPANLFAVTSLRQLAELASKACRDDQLANDAHTLAEEVSRALMQYAQVNSVEHGKIWAYEIDGYGSSLRMDDANAPGLLSLSYLGCMKKTDPIFMATRAFVLSKDNPYYFSGKAAEGVGSPHTGVDFIWPMSILMQAFSSSSDAEITRCLKLLRDNTAGTHFMHESFHKDDSNNFTRPWFAWANTLFGELILTLAEQRPAILKQNFA